MIRPCMHAIIHISHIVYQIAATSATYIWGDSSLALLEWRPAAVLQHWELTAFLALLEWRPAAVLQHGTHSISFSGDKHCFGLEI
jgi:hypothetical protein